MQWAGRLAVQLALRYRVNFQRLPGDPFDPQVFKIVLAPVPPLLERFCIFNDRAQRFRQSYRIPGWNEHAGFSVLQ
jgi:hypothetical protein